MDCLRLPINRIIIFLLWLLISLPPHLASAHPADMYAQEQSIVFTPAGAEIDWKITPGPLLADTIWNDADLNQDGTINQDEELTWLRPYLPQWTIKLDHQSLAAVQMKSISWPEKKVNLEAGDKPIDVSLVLQWPADLTGKHQIEIHNNFQETISLNWFTLRSTSGLSFDKPVQSNGQLQFNLSIPGNGTSTSLELTSWESGRPELPDLSGTLSNMAITLANPGSAKQPGNALTNTVAALTSLVRTQNFTPWFFFYAFLLSLALGCLHALTPGHGKTLVAAYLVGSHGRARDAIFLGSVVTITHTGSVLLLGLITLLASRYILPALVVPVLEIVSGVGVVGFGAYLLIQRTRTLYTWYRSDRTQRVARRFASVSQKNSSPGYSAISFSHVHEEGFFHSHDHPHPAHTHVGNHIHGGFGQHVHEHALPGNQVSWKSLLTLGISGGLVPCPDAIAILLVAVAVNRIPLGMLLIVAFSLGLALVLILIGLAMVNGVRIIRRSEYLDRISIYMPALSALIVLGLGIGLTITALNATIFSSTAQAATQNLPPQGLSNPGSSASGALQIPVTAGSFQLQKARILYLNADQNLFDQLFVRPISGGDSLQLTHQPAGISGIALSPDGKTVLYSALKKDQGSSIWSIRMDGSQSHLLLDCPQSECVDPVWFPDGQKLIYERHDDSPDSPLLLYSLWWLDLKSGATKPVFRDPGFPSFTPRFSFDGKWLSYVSPSNNTLQIYNLLDGKSISIPYRSNVPEIWSPIDETILYWDNVTHQDQILLNLMRYDIPTGQKISLDGAAGEQDNLAAWSPDGQWIAISRGTADPAGFTHEEKVWLVKPDGSHARILLDHNGVSYGGIGWSPDSRYLLHTRYSDDQKEENGIWIVDVKTGQEVKLISEGKQPVFLP